MAAIDPKKSRWQPVFLVGRGDRVKTDSGVASTRIVAYPKVITHLSYIMKVCFYFDEGAKDRSESTGSV
jgi:hypothetical protein